MKAKMLDKDKGNLVGLAENLENLYQEETRIRAISCAFINDDVTCQNNLKLVHSCMDMLMWLHQRNPKFKGDKETALAMLRARAFNSAASCLKLLLSGYYQPAVSSLREILELSFLMDYFCLENGSIERWIKNPDAKEFRPYSIRDALDKRDGFNDEKRKAAYKLLCSYGTHPTYESIIMMTNENGLITGPFSSLKHLTALLSELAMNFPHMVLSFMRFEKDLTLQELKMKAEFFRLLSDWWKNNIGTNLNEGQLDEIEEIIRNHGF